MIKYFLFFILLSTLVLAKPIATVEGRINTNSDKELEGVVVPPNPPTILPTETPQDTANPVIGILIMLSIVAVGLIAFIKIDRMIK